MQNSGGRNTEVAVLYSTEIQRDALIIGRYWEY
jgi:hypothetical protein